MIVFSLQVQSVQRLCDGVNRLIELERMLERGEDIEDVLPAPLIPRKQLEFKV